ncbi:MAG TPA: ATPase, T2SS/T4P/T4SS family, partial [Pirellulaceae bacterium]|nr:ATPase, T2SS/T4P/T4SS family [Pirellulaceae bacterium]
MPVLDAPIRLGNILVERGYLTVDQIQSALAHQHQSGKSKLLGEIVVDLEYCTEDQVVECLASGYGVPYAKLEARLCDPKVTDLLPREYIERHLVFPLFCIRGVLTVAVSEPSNLFLIDELRNQAGKEIQIVASSTKDIRRMITSLPDSKVFVIDDIIEDSDQTEVTLIENAIEDIGDVEEVAGQSPVIRLVNYVIYTAVKEGASDIHIEPAERCLRVRNRIDGKLYKALEVPQHLLPAVTSRIKILGRMDVTEKRRPQDGRLKTRTPEGNEVELRLATLPTAFGEKLVMRIFDPDVLQKSFELYLSYFPSYKA